MKELTQAQVEDLMLEQAREKHYEDKLKQVCFLCSQKIEQDEAEEIKIDGGEKAVVCGGCLDELNDLAREEQNKNGYI